MSEGFDCFLHSSQILLQKIFLMLVSILFFFSESMVISDACIYQGDQRNDCARASLPPSERITLSKCPCWTFMLRPCPTGVDKHNTWCELLLATDKRLFKGRNLKTSSFWKWICFLLASETPFELITPWEIKETILHANVGFNVTHHTFKFRSPDMGKKSVCMAWTKKWRE